MKLVSFLHDSQPRIGLVRGNQVVDLSVADPSLPRCMKALLEMGPEGLQRVRACADSLECLRWEDLKLLPPVSHPEKVIGVGVNYADHAAESPPDGRACCPAAEAGGPEAGPAGNFAEDIAKNQPCADAGDQAHDAYQHCMDFHGIFSFQ